MLNKLIVSLHVVSVFGFLLAHGASASISYALKRERDMPKIRAARSFGRAISDHALDFARMVKPF